MQVRFKTRVIAEAATSLRCKTDAGAVYSNFCSYLWPEDISLASLHVELCKLFGQSPDGDERVGFCNWPSRQQFPEGPSTECDDLFTGRGRSLGLPWRCERCSSWLFAGRSTFVAATVPWRRAKQLSAGNARRPAGKGVGHRCSERRCVEATGQRNY